MNLQALNERLSAENAQLQFQGRDLLQALQNVRNCLERLDTIGEGISDTLWYSKNETLYDYIDSEIEKHKAIRSLSSKQQDKTDKGESRG